MFCLYPNDKIPAYIMFAFPAPDKVMMFTDHSMISVLKDDTPCESVLLDEIIVDASLWVDTVFVSTENSVTQFWFYDYYILVNNI